MERTRAVKRKKVIHSSSRRYWAEVCTCFTSRCLCSLCTLAVVCQSMRVYFKLFICVIVFFFFFCLCSVPVCVVQVESACIHWCDHSSLRGVWETWAHTRARPLLFVSCVHIKTGMALYSQETIHSINHLPLRATSSHYGTMVFCLWRTWLLHQSCKHHCLWSQQQGWVVISTLFYKVCELLENFLKMCQTHPLAVYWPLYASYPRWPLMRQANLIAGDVPESPSGVLDE